MRLTAEILLEDIKGYKFAWNYLHLCPIWERGRSILVSTYVGGRHLLQEELAARYPNLKEQEKHTA